MRSALHIVSASLTYVSHCRASAIRVVPRAISRSCFCRLLDDTQLMPRSAAFSMAVTIPASCTLCHKYAWLAGCAPRRANALSDPLDKWIGHAVALIDKDRAA